MATKHRYRKGRRYEYKAKRVLEEEGFEVVRSAASKGKWDLVAIKPGCVRLIQIKKGKPTSRVLKNYMPLTTDIAVVIREIWFYQEGKGFTSVRCDGQDFAKVIYEEVGKKHDSRSRESDR